MMAVLPVSEMVLVPFMSSEGIAFPTYISFDLTPKLVRNTAAWSLHGTEGVERREGERCVYVCGRKEHPRDEIKGRMNFLLLMSEVFCC